MALEIERKFLVTSNTYKSLSFKTEYLKQGFLNSNKNRVVRVRLTNYTGFLTIKGKSNSSGTSRYEWEKEISKQEAKELLLLCEEGIVEKNRFYVHVEDHTFEVDEFLGNNQGLVVAEVELSSENEYFKIPSWLGKEVTGEEKYYNSQLSKKPFKFW